MPFDQTISDSAISAADRNVVEKYGFDVKDKDGKFMVFDPQRKAHGRPVKYGPGSNLSLLLIAAVEYHDKAMSRKHGASSGNAQASNSNESVDDDNNAEPTTSSETGDGVASETSENTSEVTRVYREWDALIAPFTDVTAKYGLMITRALIGGGDLAFQVEDPAVAKFYAFKDASKKGKYVGPDLDKLIAEAVAIHDGMLAEQGVPGLHDTEGVGEKPAANNKPASQKKTRKDNRYLRAFRVLAAGYMGDGVTHTEVASKGQLSGSSILYCVEAWEAAIKVLNEDDNILKKMILELTTTGKLTTGIKE